MIQKIEILFLRKETSWILLVLYSLFLFITFFIPIEFLTKAFILFMGSTFLGIAGMYYSHCIEITKTTKLYSALDSLLLVLYIIIFLYIPTLFQNTLAMIGIQFCALLEMILIKNVLQVYLNTVTLEN